MSVQSGRARYAYQHRDRGTVPAADLSDGELRYGQSARGVDPERRAELAAEWTARGGSRREEQAADALAGASLLTMMERALGPALGTRRAPDA